MATTNGTGGSVWRRSGGDWTEFPIATGQQLSALWGYGSNELYVVGSDMTISRFDGTQWTNLRFTPNPTSNSEIRDLWGPAPGAFSMAIWDVITWFDGTSWDYRTTSLTHMFGLWGLSLTDQFAVSTGVSVHMVGGVVSRYPTPSSIPLYDIWGNAANDLYAVGRYGQVAHFNGSAWQAINAGSADDLRDVCITPAGGVAVGARGAVLTLQGSQWMEETVGSAYDLAGVWSDGTVTIAVGRSLINVVDWQQAILVNDGSGWVDAGVIGEAHRLFGVWGSSANDVYAVGWAGEVLHDNGIDWSVMATLGGDAAYLKAVSGSGPDNVIAVGRTSDLRALICRYDGISWTKTVLEDVEELSGIWVESATSAIAVGSFGDIRRFDGSTWTTMRSPTSEQLLDVWGSGPNDVYATGWAGTLLHYDGSAWTEWKAQTHRNLNAVAGRPSGEVYFAGDRGSILYDDGM